MLRTAHADALEGAGAQVFNPLIDNAFLLDGHTDAEAVLGTKLLNWRGPDVGLERVRQSGGCVLQLLTPPGPSPMQLAEAEMAADKGVPVVVVDCTDVNSEAFDYHFDEMPHVRALHDGDLAADDDDDEPPEQGLQEDSVDFDA